MTPEDITNSVLDSDEHREFDLWRRCRFEGRKGGVVLVSCLVGGVVTGFGTVSALSAALDALLVPAPPTWVSACLLIALALLGLLLSAFFAAYIAAFLDAVRVRRAFPDLTTLPVWSLESRSFRRRARRYARKHLDAQGLETLHVLSREVGTDFVTAVVIAKEL